MVFLLIILAMDVEDRPCPPLLEAGSEACGMNAEEEGSPDQDHCSGHFPKEVILGFNLKK